MELTKLHLVRAPPYPVLISFSPLRPFHFQGMTGFPGVVRLIISRSESVSICSLSSISR